MKDFRSKIKEEMKNKKYSIVSDDLDGVISALIIYMIYGIKPVGYFSPIIFGMDKEYLAKRDEIIGLDLTLDKKNKLNIKTISNHVERFYGIDKTTTSISCNDHIDDSIYEKKSLLSTTLMLWITYDLPLPETLEGQRILLAIDSTYKQYYNDKFKDIIEADLKFFNREDILEVLKNSKKEDFEDVQKGYYMSTKLELIRHDYYLMEVDFTRFKVAIPINIITDMLGLPQLDFYLTFSSWCELKRGYCSPDEYLRIREKEKVFSYAIPYKRSVSYSVINKIYG